MACDRNGYLGPECLNPLMGGYYAAPGPAAAWNACGAEIKREEGVTIRVNGADSAYRNFARQQYWRNYWCGRGLCQNAAVPGTSNHGLGWAFDVPSYVSALLDRYGAKYGFRRVCSDAPWESWHWKWCGGWHGEDPGPDGVYRDPYPTLRRGDKGGAVRRAQKHLKRWNLGLERPTPDGSFGKMTKRATRQFQAVHGLKPDGVIGAKTWRALRKKDHFLDDERAYLNRFRWARFKGFRGYEKKQLRKWRMWMALRAKSIRAVAKEHGWKGQHRRQRFETLRRVAGGVYDNVQLPN